MGRLVLTKIINNATLNSDYELFCGNCVYFETESCPYYGSVLCLTEACERYYD